MKLDGTNFGQNTFCKPLGGSPVSVPGPKPIIFPERAMSDPLAESIDLRFCAQAANWQPTRPEWKQIVDQLRLSPQQARIVRRILQGMGDKQIAADLGIGIPTVRTHLTRLYVRLGVVDRVQLILHVFTCVHRP